MRLHKLICTPSRFIVIIGILLSCYGLSRILTDLLNSTNDPPKPRQNVFPDQSQKSLSKTEREVVKIKVNAKNEEEVDKIEIKAENEKKEVKPKRNAENVVTTPRTKSQHLPKFIIFGIRKAGTSALQEYLNLHPKLVSAKINVDVYDEPHFFLNRFWKEGLDFYRHMMPESYDDQITFEKSCNYFIKHYEDVPARVFAYNSSIKLILVVRDPTVRLISDYTDIRDWEFFNSYYPPFEEKVFDKTGQIDVNYMPVNVSRYDYHIEKWLKVFPVEQILIVDGDILKVNPLPEMKKVEKYLGLKPWFSTDQFFFNETKGFYCTNNGKKIKCLDGEKGRKHPVVSPENIAKVRDFFRPYNRRFFQMIGREFDWP